MLKRLLVSGSVLMALIASIFLPSVALAASSADGFSLQVSPSPIIETVKPGQSSTIELKIRNTGAHKEELRIGLRSFKINDTNGDVELQNDEPKDVSDWVHFSDPSFDIEAGALFTEKVNLDVPANAGFSYSFALLVSRSSPAQQSPGKTAIEGSVAVFMLLTVDRPDAVKKVDVLTFTSKKKVYEFLPTEFSLQMKNSGNTIVQPSGNIFVQRGEKSATPIATLAVNGTGAYFLPGVTKTVNASWNDGFPAYKTDGAGKKHLFWDWGTLQKFRFGHFVAKAVVIYNDGIRDVPTEVTISFWVIPWRLLGVLLVIIILTIVGIVTLVRKTARLAHKKHANEKS